MVSRARTLALLGAFLTVATLVAVGGAAAAVFLFFASGLLLAALYGEAGTAPAPEGAVGNAGNDNAEFMEPDPSGADAKYGSSRLQSLATVLFYYVGGICLCSVGALAVFTVT